MFRVVVIAAVLAAILMYSPCTAERDAPVPAPRLGAPLQGWEGGGLVGSDEQGR